MLRNALHSTLLSFRDWKRCLTFFHINVYSCYISLFRSCSCKYILKISVFAFLRYQIPDTTACPRLCRLQAFLVLGLLGDIAVDLTVLTAASQKLSQSSLIVNKSVDTVSAGVEQSLHDLHLLSHPGMKKISMGCGLSYKRAQALNKH